MQSVPLGDNLHEMSAQFWRKKQNKKRKTKKKKKKKKKQKKKSKCRLLSILPSMQSFANQTVNDVGFIDVSSQKHAYIILTPLNPTFI